MKKIITAVEIEKSFRAEFQQLLDKYNAEITADDFWTGYAECGQDIRIEVVIDSIYNEDHECIQEFVEFDLGQYHYPKKKEG